MGELLTNPTYRRDLQTALNTVENRDVLEVEPITTTALKMNVRIGEFVVSTTPDSGSATSVISSSLAKRIGLTVQDIPVQRVRTLNHQVEIIGAVENAPIQIGQAETPISLRVVESDRNTLLLGMDWYKKYQVDLKTFKKCIEFTINGQKYQTKISFQDQDTLFIVEIDREDDEGVETLIRAD